jgi:hypothetical protein
MYRYTLHVPLVMNDGRAVPPDSLDGVARALVGMFGGFTRVDGFGGWDGANALYLEPVALFHVDSDHPEAENLLAGYAGTLAAALAQECVYLTVQPITTRLIQPTTEEA